MTHEVFDRDMVFLAGFPKCGTTYAANLFARHSAICVSEPKEPRYFDHAFFGSPIQSFETYRDCFAVSEGHKVLLDGSVDYAYSANAIAEITRQFPGAKALLFLRPYTEIYHSLHWQEVTSGYEVETDPGTAWRGDFHVRAARAGRSCPNPALLDYRSRISVGFQSERVISCFGPENVLMVDFNHFRTDTLGALADIFAFMGVENEVIATDQDTHSHVSVGAPKLNRMSSVISQFKNKYGFLPSLGVARRLKKLSSSLGGKRVGLDDALRSEIDRDMAEDKTAVRRALQSVKSVGAFAYYDPS